MLKLRLWSSWISAIAGFDFLFTGMLIDKIARFPQYRGPVLLATKQPEILLRFQLDVPTIQALRARISTRGSG